MLMTLVMIGFGVIHAPPPTVDFVFQVPVRIENMRHVTSAIVSCGISHSDGVRTAVGVPGSGIVSVPVIDGAYNGTITVTVTVTPERMAMYPPTDWQCGLAYRWRNPDGTEFNESLRAGEREGFYTRLTGQAISEATTEVRGLLPPP